MNYIQQLGQNAARAKKQIAGCPTGEKNRILTEIAAILRANASEILKANEQDIAQAKDNGISDTMIDRLRLTMERIDGIADACLKLTDLEDPVGEVIEGSTRPNGMKITKIRVPMGVIGIIFESRPNVTVDAAALCIKSGNAAILRGGKEAFHSNCKLMELMREAVAKCGYDKDMIQLVEDTSREVSTQMMRANDSIDVLIPRGGAGLIQAVVQNATVPVIETGTGNCHIYVDETADLAMAVQITDNGKTQRPSVCNALETCLVHEAVAEQFLPMLQQKLEEHQVEIRGCERTRQILGDSVIPATEEDYATEFLDYIISIRVVSSVDEAIQHISKYSTGHSECIITESYRNAGKIPKGSGFCMCICQLLDKIYRWWRIWFGCRNWNLDAETACERTNGTAGNDNNEVSDLWRWTDSIMETSYKKERQRWDYRQQCMVIVCRSYCLARQMQANQV